VGDDDDISEAIFFFYKAAFGFWFDKVLPASDGLVELRQQRHNESFYNTLRMHHLYRLVSLCAFGSRLCHPLVNMISQIAHSQIDIVSVLCKSLPAIEFKRCPCEFGTESNNKTFYRGCGFFGDVVRHMMWICICSLDWQIQARRPAPDHTRKIDKCYILVSCNRLAKSELVLDAVCF
jgi:hypothetical protein